MTARGEPLEDSRTGNEREALAVREALRRETDLRRRAEAAERRWAFLAQAGELLNSSLDLDETLLRLACLVVPDKADWCAVDMTRADGSLERVAAAGTAPSAEIEDVGPPVTATGLPRLFPVLPGAGADGGASSAMVLPLAIRGRTLGTLTMRRAAPAYVDEDVELAEELARRAAVAVDNARLYRERSHIARTLQESLLPPHLPEIPGFEVAARYRAAGEGTDVSGDFYDLFQTTDGCWSVLMGDVCGKGADAAALTALARHTLRAAAIREASPSRVLELLNDAILRADPAERLCTVAYASLCPNRDGSTGVRLASAGHPLPLVLRASGAVETAGSPGTMLGVEAAPRLHDADLELEPGDALVLHTDGVADDASPDQILSSVELRAIVAAAAGQSADGIAARIEQPLLALSEGGLRDDAAILVLRRSS